MSGFKAPSHRLAGRERLPADQRYESRGRGYYGAALAVLGRDASGGPVVDRSADSDFLRPGSPGRGSGVSMATISARVRHDHVEHAVITPTNHPMLRVHRK